MQYHSPSAFCLLPCSICPLIQTWAEGLNSCCCLVLKLKLCNVFISLYMFLSALAPVVPTNIYHSSFYRRIYCSPIYTLNNLWYYCISTCPFQYNVRSSVPRILPFLKICYTIFFHKCSYLQKNFSLPELALPPHLSSAIVSWFAHYVFIFLKTPYSR